MNDLSVKETAAQWGVSTALVRRYCKEGRIPKAVLKETGWLIPAHARKPGSEVVVVEKKKELPPAALCARIFMRINISGCPTGNHSLMLILRLGGTPN